MNVVTPHFETKSAAPAGELLREANHRISNHLGLLMGMVHTQINGVDQGPEHLTREEAKGMLQATAGKLVSLSRLHRLLSERSHLDTIMLSDYVVDVCASVNSSLTPGRLYVMHTWAADCRLSPAEAQYIGLLINEIMVNALKHAHPAGLPVQLEIRCERHASGRVSLIIGDDGVGLPETMNATAGGAGFALIRALTKSLNAELRIESDSLGLTFVITLPPTVTR